MAGSSQHESEVGMLGRGGTGAPTCTGEPTRTGVWGPPHRSCLWAPRHGGNISLGTQLWAHLTGEGPALLFSHPPALLSSHPPDRCSHLAQSRKAAPSCSTHPLSSGRRIGRGPRRSSERSQRDASPEPSPVPCAAWGTDPYARGGTRHPGPASR